MLMSYSDLVHFEGFLFIHRTQESNGADFKKSYDLQINRSCLVKCNVTNTNHYGDTDNSSYDEF